MSISTRLKTFLGENQIPYSVMTHTTAYTAQGAAATMQISGKELVKSVILRAGEEMLLAVLPAPSHVRLDKPPAEVGRPVRQLRSRNSAVCSPIVSPAPCRLSVLFINCQRT